MAVKQTINDGKWQLKLPDGAPSFYFPFMDVGDNETFEATVNYSQDAAAFVRPGLMDKATFVLGTAYRVGISEVRYDTCGLLRWTETYASLPKTRTEGMVYPYSQQYITTGAGVIPSITEVTWTKPGYWQYEYFLADPAPPPPIFKIRCEVIGDILYTYGVANGQFPTNPNDVNLILVADDSTVEIYKAGIYVRKTPYVYSNYPNETIAPP